MRGFMILLIMIGFLQADRLGSVAGVELDLPLPIMIEPFIEKSIGHIPKAIIRDGLPFFGAKRGDFKRKDRLHRGYDIYVNHMDVLASASGKVIEIAHGKRSGTHIKLQHENEVQTLYIHLASVLVKRGDKVKRGQVIGRIDGATGNAVAPQLHFEIKVKAEAQNPLSFLKKTYHDSEILKKIRGYEKNMKKAVGVRDALVRAYLKNH